MQPLEIQSFSYEDRSGLLATLCNALADGGGWVLERRSLSVSTVEVKVEAQLRSIAELYCAIIAAGLELTRSSHLKLTDLCNCHRYAIGVVDSSQIITLALEISFLEEVTEYAQMATRAPV